MRLNYCPVLSLSSKKKQMVVYVQWYDKGNIKPSMDQELPDVSAYSLGTHQMAALFCMEWRYGRHIDSVTSNRKCDSVN